MQVRQKGQTIVEFALVLPVFMLFFWGIIYMGMLFSDYLTLSEIARDSTRYAAITMTDEMNVNEIKEKYQDRKLVTTLYKWDPKADNDFAVIKQGDSDKYVEVILTAHHDDSGDILGFIIPKQISVNCKMRREIQ
ncbi:TadE family protein [Pectinatus brassicae]|uniref:TadE-like domain-containing protein n=1 Tax=Pectinatus brassicae TaxID=862415 RepID=A0A840ULG6_9FIRM|nr:TadE family protein [Pectinatus brassicae]MBB5335082.1 hypothetical protein [Pectinatus brassicae]